MRENNSTAVTNFNAPVNLQSTSTVDVTGTAQLTFTQAVSGVGGLTKTDPGTLILGGTAADTYGGITRVSGGILVLDKPDGTAAIPGDISIQATTNTIQGVLQLGANNQIADSSNVTLNQSTGTGTPNGLFALNGFHDTIGSLSSSGGAGIVQNGSAASNSTLAINAALSPSNFTGLIQDGGAASLALLVGRSGIDADRRQYIQRWHHGQRWFVDREQHLGLGNGRVVPSPSVPQARWPAVVRLPARSALRRARWLPAMGCPRRKL